MSETSSRHAYRGGHNAGRSVRVPRPRDVSKVDRMLEAGYREKVIQVAVPLQEIGAELKRAEEEILRLLREVTA